MFARGDLDEMRKAVEAMQAAGLEAAEARDKLTRVEEALKKVSRALVFSHLKAFSISGCNRVVLKTIDGT